MRYSDAVICSGIVMQSWLESGLGLSPHSAACDIGGLKLLRTWIGCEVTWLVIIRS